jgi:hypothetical protein
VPGPPVGIRVVSLAIGYVTDSADCLPAPKGQHTGRMKFPTSPTAGAPLVPDGGTPGIVRYRRLGGGGDENLLAAERGGIR